MSSDPFRKDNRTTCNLIKLTTNNRIIRADNSREDKYPTKGFSLTDHRNTDIKTQEQRGAKPLQAQTSYRRNQLNPQSRQQRHSL